MVSVVFASDHGGILYKTLLIQYISNKGYTIIDVGCESNEAVDFPVYAKLACEKILNGEASIGVLVCGSGNGMAIAANRFNGIRCAVCHDYFTAVNSRKKDNANMIALGERVIGIEVAKQMVEGFLESKFIQDNEDYNRRSQMCDLINP